MPPVWLQQDRVDLFEVDSASSVADGFEQGCNAEVAGAAQDAQWNLAYQDTNIGADFLARFGNYCLIGEGGPWISDRLAAYVVYMPPNLYYPWHHHKAEEIYCVIAGEAKFMREGEATQTHVTGDVVFHASNQPHAAQTDASGMLAYVLWRNHLGSELFLTERDVRVAT